jgi:hypothetical protein
MAYTFKDNRSGSNIRLENLCRYARKKILEQIPEQGGFMDLNPFTPAAFRLGKARP